MGRNNTADRMTAREMAGHATEMGAWRFVHDVSTQLSALHGEGRTHGGVTLGGVRVEGRTFVLGEAHGGVAAGDDVWQLGACVYELVTGGLPFGGQGREGQRAESPLPVLSESRGSRALSELMASCLAYDSSQRPSAEAIAATSAEELVRCERYFADMENLKYRKPQNRQIRMKTYTFWPEALMCLVLVVMMAVPQRAKAQTDAEMQKLIRLTTTMRDQSKRGYVLGELRADDKWTLMDELRRDANECTYGDRVNMFGLNDIAAEIAQRERGIVNVGGRFKHSADGKHHYSFIELTAVAGQSIYYRVDGHAGTQQIAIVPFDAKSRYTATFYSDGREVKAHTLRDGIAYFTVPVGTHGYYEFEIQNRDAMNASYAVITYNPMTK